MHTRSINDLSSNEFDRFNDMMSMKSLYGFVVKRCKICNTCKLFYVGEDSVQQGVVDIDNEFAPSDRICKCGKYIFDNTDSIVRIEHWPLDYICEAISGELENQNRHRMTSHPSKLLDSLKYVDLTDATKAYILVTYFHEILGGNN